MPKQRIHNEWFRQVSLGNRKSCPRCSCKLEPGESIWSWGEYIRVKWHTVKHFCKNCYETEVKKPLLDHTGGCGCTVKLIFKGSSQPAWFKLEENPVECAA